MTITQIAVAQRYERTDSLDYGAQVQAWMGRSTDTTTAYLGRQFANYWATGNLTDSQKKQIEGITAKMLAKNYKFQP